MGFIKKDKLECLPFYFASAPLLGFSVDTALFILFRKKFSITFFLFHLFAVVS